MSSVGARTGGWRRWFSAVPPGKSSGRLRQKLTPASTSRTPCSTFSGVTRLIRPSSSSSPQSPHVDPAGRCVQRFGTALSPSPVERYCLTKRMCTDRSKNGNAHQQRSHEMIGRDFVVSGDGHVLEPTDLYKPRLPKHLGDRGVWEEDFEVDPPFEGGARVFRRLHTSGYEGWTVSRYRQTQGRTPEGDPELILEDMAVDGVDVQVMHPNLSLFGLYSDDHELSMAHARVYNNYIIERFSPYFDRLCPTAPIPIT